MAARSVGTPSDRVNSWRAPVLASPERDARAVLRRSSGAEQLRRPPDVARVDPEQDAIASAAGADGIDGGDVDARVGELAHRLRAGADPVVAFDEEHPLGPG